MTLSVLIITNLAIAVAVVYALLHFLTHAVYTERRLAISQAADAVPLVDDVAPIAA